MFPFRRSALLLALAIGTIARAEVHFQVWNPTDNPWTLVPAAEGPLGVRQYWTDAGLGNAVSYRARPGEGVPVPPRHSVRFHFAGAQGAALFHLCDHLWKAGQSAAGGPANPHSVRLGLTWETPAGQQRPVASALLDSAPGASGLSQAQLDRLGGWSGDMFTLRALAHSELVAETGAGFPAATRATATLAELSLDTVEVLDQGWVVPAGAGAGAATAADGSEFKGAAGGSEAAATPIALSVQGAGAGGAGASAAAAQQPAGLPMGSRKTKFQANLQRFADFIQNHPGEFIPTHTRQGRRNPLMIWLNNTRQRLAALTEADRAAFQHLYATYRNQGPLLQAFGSAPGAAGMQDTLAPMPEPRMTVIIENHDRRHWRLWKGTGRAVPLWRGSLGSTQGGFDGFLDPGGRLIPPGTWVELDFRKPATRLAGAWMHSPSQDCLKTAAGSLLFRHHLAPAQVQPDFEFTFGIDLRAATRLQDADGSLAEVHPDPGQTLPAGMLTWGDNRILILGPQPSPAGAGPAVESKAPQGAAEEGEADAEPDARPDWGLVPVTWAAGAGSSSGFPPPEAYGPILPLEAEPLERSGESTAEGGLAGLASLFSLPDGFGDNVEPE